jgi:CBS domain-containing protein
MARGDRWRTLAAREERSTAVKTATHQLAVAEAMHRGVVTCEVGTPLSKVAQMMVGHRIHCVVVSSGDEEGPPLWGVVSDLDLVAAIASGDEDETAGKVAATPAVTVGMREPLARAAQLMAEHEVTHLVVVDPRSLRPVDVLSTLDVAQTLAD